MDGLHDDFRDLLVELADAGARFMIVGGFAVAHHGHPRATKNIDIWLDATDDNAALVFRALERFGAPTKQLDITERDLSSYDGVIQLGVPPVRIDILCRIKAVAFADAWRGRSEIQVDGRVVPVIGLEQLLENKRACARPQDLADVDALDRG